MVADTHEVSFLALDALFKKPLLNKVISSLNAYPIAGKNFDVQSFKIVADLLKKEAHIAIFPEGTRATEDKLRPLKAGVVVLALQSEVPIIPLYIHGSGKIWPRQHLFPKLWGNLACIIGSPIDWRPYADMPKKEGRQAFLDHLTQSIQTLKRWYEAGAIGSPP